MRLNRSEKKALELLGSQGVADVSTADVVVTNPTHYAVALKYEKGTDNAPIVVAKGENLLARRIKLIAKEHEVPMIENKPIAQTLYALGRVGEQIPIQLYKVVAEILAEVYKKHAYYFHRLKARRILSKMPLAKSFHERITSEFPKLLLSIKGNSDLGFAFGLFGAVLLLVLPIHKDILSILLVFSIAISLLILLTVIYVKDPPEFSVFPTLLLAVTLYRLGLNVASTRLILLDGDAGSVIQSFGTFVVGGNYVVGAVIFFILVIINFVVITKGIGRIAEVTARFTLDACPVNKCRSMRK